MQVLCMHWEVEIDMSGQSNVSLRVGNVKTKKITRVEMGHISENVWFNRL